MEGGESRDDRHARVASADEQSRSEEADSAERCVAIEDSLRDVLP